MPVLERGNARKISGPSVFDSGPDSGLASASGRAPGMLPERFPGDVPLQLDSVSDIGFSTSSGSGSSSSGPGVGSEFGAWRRAWELGSKTGSSSDGVADKKLVHRRKNQFLRDVDPSVKGYSACQTCWCIVNDHPDVIPPFRQQHAEKCCFHYASKKKPVGRPSETNDKGNPTCGYFFCGEPHTKKCPFHPDRFGNPGGAVVLRTGLPATYKRGPKKNLVPELVFMDPKCVRQWRKARGCDVVEKDISKEPNYFNKEKKLIFVEKDRDTMGRIIYRKKQKHIKRGRPRDPVRGRAKALPAPEIPTRTRAPVGVRGNKGKSRELEWLQQNAARWVPSAPKRRRIQQRASPPEDAAAMD